MRYREFFMPVPPSPRRPRYRRAGMKPNGMEGIQNGSFVKHNTAVALSLRPQSECPTREKDPLRHPGFLPPGAAITPRVGLCPVRPPDLLRGPQPSWSPLAKAGSILRSRCRRSRWGAGLGIRTMWESSVEPVGQNRIFFFIFNASVRDGWTLYVLDLTAKIDSRWGYHAAYPPARRRNPMSERTLSIEYCVA